MKRDVFAVFTSVDEGQLNRIGTLVGRWMNTQERVDPARNIIVTLSEMVEGVLNSILDEAREADGRVKL